jgi:uridine monophosphate synthetase
VNTALSIAKQHPDFVFGFISQERLVHTENEWEQWVYCTPGVNISATGDSAGQNYNSPQHVISK